jgi:hypothetical protein
MLPDKPILLVLAADPFLTLRKAVKDLDVPSSMAVNILRIAARSIQLPT